MHHCCQQSKEDLRYHLQKLCLQNKENLLRLYKSLVRSHLEYCVHAWRPYLQKDGDNLEKVQRRFTRMIPGLAHLSYTLRLEYCDLISLEIRQLRADLGEVFKIMNGFENVNSANHQSTALRKKFSHT